MTVRADLHVHTALSPCGDDEMTPPAIVDAALAAGLRHDRRLRPQRARQHRRRPARPPASRLTVLAGIEITTAEECHVVGLFPTVPAAANAADEVRETLPVADDDYTRFFGEQYVLSADGTIYGARAARAGPGDAR